MSFSDFMKKTIDQWFQSESTAPEEYVKYARARVFDEDTGSDVPENLIEQ